MDNLFENIFSIVDIDLINSKKEFDEYILYLTNHPTPLREAAAYKLEELYNDCFLDKNVLEIILNAIIDINPNVSRCVCKTIEKNKKLQEMIEPEIIAKIEKLLLDITQEEKTEKNKSHSKNKKIFSLYWLLEALFYCISEKYIKNVLEILHSALNFSDYTIREKAAQILTKLPHKPVELIQKIKDDPNFYVNFYINLYKDECL